MTAVAGCSGMYTKEMNPLGGFDVERLVFAS